MIKTYYKQDPNKRVYIDPDTGEKFGSPIYKYSFRAYYLIGETSRSFLLSHFKDVAIDHHSIIKIPKNESFKSRWFLTYQEMQDDIYLHNNLHRIIEKLRSCSDTALIMKIEEMLNAK